MVKQDLLNPVGTFGDSNKNDYEAVLARKT